MRNEKKLELKKKKAALRNKRLSQYRSRPHNCGGCRECCYLYPLPGKPARKWCQHITDKGCGIYATRPPLCSGFKCGYLWDPAMPRHWRPDRSGVIIVNRQVDGVKVVVLSDVRPLAHEGLIAQDIIHWCVRAGYVVLTVDCCSHCEKIIAKYKHTGLTRAYVEQLVATITAENQAEEQWQQETSKGVTF